MLGSRWRWAVTSNSRPSLHGRMAPTSAGLVPLGVFTAADLVLDDDAVGRGAAQGRALADDQGEYVPVAVVAADHQISAGVCGHGSVRERQVFVRGVTLFYLTTNAA